MAPVSQRCTCMVDTLNHLATFSCGKPVRAALKGAPGLGEWTSLRISVRTSGESEVTIARTRGNSEISGSITVRKSLHQVQIQEKEVYGAASPGSGKPYHTATTHLQECGLPRSVVRNFPDLDYPAKAGDIISYIDAKSKSKVREKSSQ